MQADAKTLPASSDSMLSLISQIRKRGFLHFIGDLWQEQGDLFKLELGGRRLILAIHPDHVHYINLTASDNYQKLDSYDTVRDLLLGDGLVTSNGDLWRHQRKLMAPFYTPRGVEAFSGIMIDEAHKLRERWDTLAATGEEINMMDEMSIVAATVILRSMFTMPGDDQLIDLAEAFELIIAFISGQQERPIRLPMWVPTPEHIKFKQSHHLLTGYINDLVEARRKLPEDQYPDDLLSRMMLARDEETGEPMSEKLLRDETMTIFLAGNETTARTLTFALYSLASEPHVLAALQAEIDSVLAADDDLTIDHLKQMPYALRVIKETLRLYPPAPFYVRDAINDDVLDGYHIPAGGSVMLSPYYTHRHPDFWDDPLTFDPMRWTPEAEKARHPYAFHAFAAGKRICIGNNFSLLESQIMLVQMIRYFVPQLREGYAPVWAMRGTLGTTNGMPMTIRRR